MTSFETYNLFLCLFVFFGFTCVFGVLLTMVVQLSLKTMRSGLDDRAIKTEYKKTRGIKKRGGVGAAVSVFFCVSVLLAFAFSIAVDLMPDKVGGTIPTVRVVNSASMASKYEDNEYLFENDLDDQFQTFDLILTYRLPSEQELKLYDIVVYEVGGILVIHRIVGIEEPNADHPDETYFLLQGDAVASPDRFPVKYKQMKAIYRGERVPFVGSFVSFMQSPAGWLCILLIVFAMCLVPVLERKFEKEKKLRLMAMGILSLRGRPMDDDDDWWTGYGEDRYD